MWFSVEKKKEQVPKQGVAVVKSKKKIDRMEETVKQQNKDLSFVKFKSLFAVTFTMIMFVGLLKSWYVSSSTCPYRPHLCDQVRWRDRGSSSLCSHWPDTEPLTQQSYGQ